MKTLLCLAILYSCTFPARADGKSASMEHLLAAIRQEIPAGWSVSFDAESDSIEITRAQPLLGFYDEPNGPPTEKPELMQFLFSFSILPKLSPADYRKVAAENSEIGKKAAPLYDALVKKHVPQKFDYFSPRTPEDQQLVAQYNALIKSLHRLPDFYFEDLSLAWSYNAPGSSLGVQIEPVAPNLADTCDRVRAKVAKILSTYQPAASR